MDFKLKKYKKEKGVSLIVFVISIILILMVSFTAIYYIFSKRKNTNVNEVSSSEILDMTEKTAKIENLGMDTRIISTLTEDGTPIPNGFSYVQGNKKTGIIVKSNENEIKYLYVPYNENVKELPSEYYKKVNYISMDLMTLNSIKKYNGFFVELNSNYKIKDLKTIDNGNYEFLYEQLQYTVENDETVTPHMIYREEIAQINNYLKINNINLGENTIGIQALAIEPFSKINPEELTIVDEPIDTSKLIDVKTQIPEITKTSNLKLNKIASNKDAKNEYVYMLKTSSKFYGGTSDSEVEIPIPSGFDYCEIDGIIMIRDTSNTNLIYIWVPTNYKNKDSLQDELWNSIYMKCETSDGKVIDKDTEVYKKIKKSEEDIDSKLEKSIKKFKGFYISQAELSEKGKIGSGEYMNISRGMVNYSVSKTSNGGDYVRGSNIKSNIYTEIKNIAEKSNKHESVVGHLTYGIEYDATLLWIAQTNSNFVDKDGNEIYTALSRKSKNVGKYSDSNLEANSSASEIKSFNAIWGIGGNLAEVTQEKYDGKYVTRGGSYNDTGEHAPIASRNLESDLNKQDIGFRTCLYINTDTKTTRTKNDKFKYNPSDDTIEEINGIKFKLLGDVPRYVNRWDGTQIYKEPNESSSVIKKLSMAEELWITSKAIDKTVKLDGTELVWTKVKLSDNEIGYVNANDLTDSITFFGENIGFIMTPNPVVRFYKDNFSVYSYPKDENILFTTAYSGQIEIIGKSVNQEWALYQVGQENRFVHAKDLTVDVSTEKIGNYTFINGTEKDFWTIEKDVNIYPSPEENNSIQTLKYGTQTTVSAISTDGVWSKVKLDSTIQGYVLTSKLSSIQPAVEEIASQNNDGDADFKITNDVVYVTASDGLNIRSSCDTSNSSNIIKNVPYRWGIDRIAQGSKGWDKVNIDGKECYAYNKYLSKTQPKLVSNTAKGKGKGKGKGNSVKKTTGSKNDNVNNTANDDDNNKVYIDDSPDVPGYYYTEPRPTEYITVTAKTTKVMVGVYKVVICAKTYKPVAGTIKSITHGGDVLRLKFSTENRGQYQYATASYIAKIGGKHSIKAKSSAGFSTTTIINVPWL